MKRAASSPRAPRKPKASVLQEAYEQLGIEDEFDVLTVSRIEPLLRKALDRPEKIEGGKVVAPKQDGMQRVWAYLETSSEEMARKLVAQKYKLKTKAQRDVVPFEAYCVAAGFSTKSVLGMILAEAITQDQQAADLMAAAAQPAVVQATIDRAVEPGGTREREFLLKHSKFLPLPKTSVVFAGSVGKIVEGDDKSQTLAVLPPIEQTVRDISDRFNERLLGQAPASIEADYMEGPEQDDDEEDEEIPV